MIIHSAKKKKKQGKKKKKVGVEVKGEIGQNMKGGGGGNIDKIGSLQKIGGGVGLATLCQLFEHYLTKT